MNKIDELNYIKQKIISDLNCPLKDSATNLVFGKGNIDADIFFIGEAPGEKEDLAGIPFVGKAGKILDSLLNSINLTLDDVYIANILKYRPPKNRNPTTDEIISHTPYLLEQILVLKPKVIVTLGNFATKYVLSEFNVNEMKKVQGISEVHGKLFKIKFNDTTFLVVPCYHPAATIYNRKLSEDIKKDFLALKEIISQ